MLDQVEDHKDSTKLIQNVNVFASLWFVCVMDPLFYGYITLEYQHETKKFL